MIVDFSTISDPAIYAYKREQVIWELLVLLSYILLSCWAVFSQKKMLVVLGSVSLLVSNLYFLIYPYQTGVGYSNDIVAYVAPCASLILVVAVVLKENKTALFIIALAILSTLDLLEIFTMIHSMLTIVFFNPMWVVRGIANGFAIIFFIALGVYMAIDDISIGDRVTTEKIEEMAK